MLAGVPAVSAAPPLPVPSGTWVTAGNALPPSVTNQTMNIQQLTPKVTLNWDSFNIDRGHTVNFNQPSPSATALNLIHQADPVLIRGALNANGEVWLLNQNGVVFGSSAEVNVRGLIASSLDVSANALEHGIAPPTAQVYAGPAFVGALDAAGKPLSQPVSVAPGAQLTTNGPNGRVYLFAPNVTNEGSITAADGQVTLAAGSEIYIRQPNAEKVSGLVIEVGKGGTVTNGAAGNAGIKDPTALLGQIVADRGTATLVGLSVNQRGRVSANSAVRANGNVRLLAREAPGTTAVLTPRQGGQVVLGANSLTATNPDPTDHSVVVDASEPLIAKTLIAGSTVVMDAGSAIEAHGGEVKIRANENGDEAFQITDTPALSMSRIAMAEGSKIDVSGSTATLDAARNALTVKLQGAELKDRPVQRNGVLRGKTVTVDLRQHGMRADGSIWIGTPLADLTSSAAADVKRSNAERHSAGGAISLEAQGGVILQIGSRLDVSGGAVKHSGGTVPTTQLFRQGKVIDISRADPNIAYEGIFGDYDLLHPKWGLTRHWSVQVGDATTAPTLGGYLEGRDAGTIALVAPRLVLEGELLGSTTVGLFQRRATDLALAQPITRPFDQLARRGRLTLGTADVTAQDPQYITPDVAIARDVTSQLPANFNLAEDPFPMSAQSVQVATDWFGGDKLGFLTLFSAGQVTLAHDALLDFGVGGGFSVQAGAIALFGKVIAPGGAVNLLARDTSDPPAVSPSTGLIALSAASAIDVSGVWANDAPAVNVNNPSSPPQVINGGTITVTALAKQADSGGLSIESGAVLRADGGGAVARNGKLSAGKGGAITLAVTADPTGERFAVPFELAGSLSAYGFNQGGRLTLNASALCIGAASCGAPDSTRLDFSPGFFTSGGFAVYDLTATGGGAVITANTAVTPRQQNLVLASDFLSRSSGSDLREFTRTTTLDDSVRRPTDFQLSVKAETPSNQFNDATLQTLGFLDLRTGASIRADTGATIGLSSDTRSVLDGTVSAPAGRINITLQSGISGSKLTEFLPSQTLWLGSHASLLAPGMLQLQPNGRNLPSGQLLDGGAVELVAKSGYLIAEKGSLIDVRGVAASLAITSFGDTAPVLTALASAGGSITLRAAEGILFDGDLRAAAARPGARAGSLQIDLDAQSRNDFGDLPHDLLKLPVSPRVVSVTVGDVASVPADLIPGLPIPNTLNGLALISDHQLHDAALGDLTLRARNYSREPNEPVHAAGVIRLAGNSELSATRRLALDAASIESTGGVAQLAAPYIAFGNADDNSDGLNKNPQLTDNLFAGTGSLRAAADTIDFIGALQLNGWRDAVFHASGDIRFRGIQPINLGAVATIDRGSLETTGNLMFAARQVYPTTLAQYSISLRDNPVGEITFAATAAGTPVLSVGGSLTVQAPFIQQQGNLKAPLGTLALNASNALSLLPGSVTSTALDGATALFGRIEIGKDWVYFLNGKNGESQGRLVFSPQSNRSADLFPAAKVELRAPTVKLLAGATVEQSGGGDLLAYEFEPGLEGSSDPLTADNLDGSYAILPSLRSDFAPYDPQEQQGFALSPGDSIELATSLPGLAAGRYALLPARYALLPGAFLITPQIGYDDLNRGTSLPLPQGGTILAGRRVFANGVESDRRTSGFLVRGAAEIAELGKFARANASDFKGLKDQARPQDAGTLQIAASQTLELGGILRARAGPGGLSARAEFVSENLSIVKDTRDAATVPGTVLINADDLNALGAATLVLGGTSSGAREARTLNVAADTVRVEAGASIQAPEIILAATDTVTVDSGAALTSIGSAAAAGELSVSGDGALLRLASGEQLTLLRTEEAGVRGTLEIRSGARLTATGATLIDASKETLLEGELRLAGSLTLGAPRISLGTPLGAADGLVLSAPTLAALKVSELVLTGRRGVDLYGDLALNFSDLVIDAPGLAGYANEAQQVTLTATRLTLRNIGGEPYLAPNATLGTGHLSLQAGQIILDKSPGAGFQIDGFATTDFAAAERILGADSGHFEIGGDLALTTSRLTTDSGVSLSLTANGRLALHPPTIPIALPILDSFGGILSLTGARVDVAGRIEMPAGQLRLHAIGSAADDAVRVLNGALLDVSGHAIDFLGTTAFAPAGSITAHAENGDVIVSDRARLDISGSPTGGAGGALKLSAPVGTLKIVSGSVRAVTAAGYSGGSLSLDADHLGPGVGELLGEFSAAGFTEALMVRVRNGDLNITGGGHNIRAHTLNFAADDGDFRISRLLDASGSTGGQIRLAASGRITLENGAVLDAHATSTSERGGNIELQSAAASDGTLEVGGIDLRASSVLNVAGAGGGQVHFRLPQASILTILDQDPDNDRLSLQGAILGAASTVLEGFRAYSDDRIDIKFRRNAIDVSDVGIVRNPRFAEIKAFMDHADFVHQALGAAANDPTFHLRPGLEIRSLSSDSSTTDGDLALNAIWDLSLWRFANEPGILTLRAAANLALNDILSDGFRGTADLAITGTDGKSRRCANPNACAFRPTGTPNLLTSGDSWSYRLVAGADFASADSLGIVAPARLVRDDIKVGSITVAPGVFSLPNRVQGPTQNPVLRPILNAIRTGTGNIELNAGRDVTLANRASVIYTAGLDTGIGVPLGTPGVSGRSTLQRRPYPERGGDIRISADGNVNGIDPALDFTADSLAFPRQLVSSWLLRQGDRGPTARATGWTVAPEYFEQGVATLGGGDVTVTAGGDVDNLSVSVASIGRQLGGDSAESSVIEVIDGGNLKVYAGGDILSGVYYVGRGAGELRAGGNLTSGRPTSVTTTDPLYPVLAVGDANVTLTAGHALDLADVINPTFIPQGPFQKQATLNRQLNSYFLSYAPNSRVALVAFNGDITVHDSSVLEAGTFELNLSNAIDSTTLRVLPPSLSATAMRGDIVLDGAYSLYPSADGNLQLLASGSVHFKQPLALSDADPTLLPGIANPLAFNTSTQQSALASLINAQDPSTALAEQPVHSKHAGGATTALVLARDGDLVSEPGARLFVAKPATLRAGRDIVNLNAIIQNTEDFDVSLVRAGRDFLYSSPRVETDSQLGAPGSLLPTTNALEVWGPGRLVIETGRDVDLGTAGGIVSRGNSINGALTSPGAAISLFAGLGSNGLNFVPFINRYFTPNSIYTPNLVALVRHAESDPTLSVDAALARFSQRAPEQQIEVILNAYFAELRATGRAAAGLESPDYSRGYAAIKTLFSANDYAGAVNLYFSQIFTIAGGNIDLLVPGGDVNVGLATPPASFGISKGTSQLGIVTEGVGDVRAYLNSDFNVNESRVFAADGGDILVWSNFGDIDAGRGARSAISVPANGFQFDNDGRLTISVPPPIQGSGIRALTTTVGRPFGNVDLVTPRGVVNASEAGIESAGNITIAAVQVLGADNIKAGGAAVGVPVAAGGIAAGVASAGGAASGATKSASDAVAGAGNRGAGNSNAIATPAPSLITVEFLGFGDG